MDSHSFFNMDLATFQDFELDLELHYRAANVDSCVSYYYVVEYNQIIMTKRYCYYIYLLFLPS